MGKLRILQVSTVDIAGGAEKVAWNLFRGYRERGHQSWLAVGRKRGADPDVLQIPNALPPKLWSRPWLALNAKLQPHARSKLISRSQTLLRLIENPRREFEAQMGVESFDFPGTDQLLQLTPASPDIVHCHNLHGYYFDPRVLPRLSHQVPVVFTLHDAWLLSGHCAHSFDCERWKTGCGHCPDLTIYPAIGRDATAWNWRRKQRIFAASRLYISTPCEWLMRKVQASMLAPAMKQSRVIPYGVDLGVFRPAPRATARIQCGIPQDAEVLIFAANGIRRSVFKDYQTMRSSIARLGERRKDGRLLMIAVGEDAPSERIGSAELRFVPYQKDPAAVAAFYQASDIYLHAARADTFPNTILEALACGIPVVATAVGGIPEQVKSLGQSDRATGILVAPSDSEAMADAIETLLNNSPLRLGLGVNAVEDARNRFCLERQVSAYLDWYHELTQN
jgi:glycosyltransferase involved in cell wall biosynthesis